MRFNCHQSSHTEYDLSIAAIRFGYPCSFTYYVISASDHRATRVLSTAVFNSRYGENSNAERRSRDFIPHIMHTHTIRKLPETGLKYHLLNPFFLLDPLFHQQLHYLSLHLRLPAYVASARSCLHSLAWFQPAILGSSSLSNTLGQYHASTPFQ